MTLYMLLLVLLFIYQSRAQWTTRVATKIPACASPCVSRYGPLLCQNRPNGFQVSVNSAEITKLFETCVSKACYAPDALELQNNIHKLCSMYFNQEDTAPTAPPNRRRSPAISYSGSAIYSLVDPSGISAPLSRQSVTSRTSSKTTTKSHGTSRVDAPSSPAYSPINAGVPAGGNGLGSARKLGDPPPSSSLSAGAIAGIGIGTGLGVVALVGAVWLYIVRQQRKRGGTPRSPWDPKESDNCSSAEGTTSSVSAAELTSEASRHELEPGSPRLEMASESVGEELSAETKPQMLASAEVYELPASTKTG